MSCDRELLTYVLLGDGDFSFSFDLAKWLSKNSRQKVRLIATGVDKEEDVHSKYKDTSFTLSRLAQINTSDSNIEVETHFQVNAVDHERPEYSHFRADYLIFNHPHLGTENAGLHFRFLCHLFHSATEAWLKKGGVFYLALAAGQFDRWKCAEAAGKHRLVVVNRCVFQSPPVNNPQYQLRRHQTGKSFASRTIGSSELISVMRQSELTDNADSPHRVPPWFNASLNLAIDKSSFECNHCGQPFREERSLRSHVAAKHGNKKRKTDTLVCQKCERRFESQQSLDDHVKAKHEALHVNLVPDWYQETRQENCCSTSDSETFCKICDVKLDDATNHLDDFRPVSVEESKLLSCKLECEFCSKQFREGRALRQHENFCSLRS